MRALVALMVLFFFQSTHAHLLGPQGRLHLTSKLTNHVFNSQDCKSTYVARSYADITNFKALVSQSGVDRNLQISGDISAVDVQVETSCEIKIQNSVKFNVTNVLALFAEEIQLGNHVQLNSGDIYFKAKNGIDLKNHSTINAQRIFFESSEEINFKNHSILTADVGIFNAPACDVSPHAERLVTQELGTCFNKLPVYLKLEVAPTSGEIPLTVSFDASKSFGLVDKFIFHFGNGEKFETNFEGASYVYTAPGSFNAKLEAKGTYGSLQTDVQTITVTAPPEVGFDIHHEVLRVNPPGIIFSTKEAPSLANIKEFLWDFGDGSDFAVPFVTSGLGFVYHDYADENDYTVKLRLRDQSNFVTPPVEKTIHAFNNLLPLPRYSIDAFKGEAPFTVNVRALDTLDSSGQPQRYKWVFTDTMQTIPLGSTREVQHTFNQPGIYQIQLTVVDGQAGSRTVLIPIYVGQTSSLPSLPPVAVLDSTNRFGAAPLTVDFTGVRSFDPDGVAGQNLTYRWSFFDYGRNQNVVFFGQNFNYNFIKPGVTQVILTVTDVTGQQNSAAVPIFVEGNRPTPGGFVVAGTTTPLQYNFNVNPFLLENSYSYESLLWDFGDGTYSSASTVNHIFPAAGTYTVSLKIRQLDGQYETYTQAVQVSATPQFQSATFATAGGKYNPGEPTTFTANLNNPSDVSTTTFTWDFGDGQSTSGVGSSFSTVSHIYPTTGLFRVTLLTKFASGLSSLSTATVTSNNVPTIGNIKIYGLPASAPATLGFAPVENVSDSDGFVQTYVYEFGDGTQPIITNQGYLEHTYQTSGSYTAKVTAIDNNGGRASRTVTVLLNANMAPIASIKLYLPPHLIAPLRMGFTGFEQSYDPDGFINQYEYDFGDGVVTTTADGYVEHTYEAAGTYQLGLRVRDDKGLWSAKVTQQLVVTNNQAPVARFTADVYDAIAPGQAFFEVWRSSSDIDGFITEYEYDFGDGTVTSDNDGFEAHNYPLAGEYIVKVRVKDDKGAWSALAEKAITILPGQKPIAINTIYNVETYAPAKVSMSAFEASYDPDGILVQVEYKFGDGEVILVPMSQAYQEHTYAQAGNYVIQMRVQDSDGMWSDYSSNTVEIKQAQAPVIGNIPVYGDTNRPAPVTLAFAANEVTTSNHHPLNYTFDFGDGIVVDNGGNGFVEHTFTQPGVKTVTVTVKDSRNQTTSKSLQVTIKENQPPSLMGINIFGDFASSAPLNVSFNMFGQIVDEYGQVASIHYDFGDGNIASSLNTVEHIYESPGTYLVIVSVTDDQGAIARISREVIINANQPPIALALKVLNLNNSVLAPVRISVSAFESFQDMDGVISRYIYDFGDGDVQETGNGYLEHTYTTPGTYLVKVTAFDNKEASVQSSHVINVRTNAPPVAHFTLPKAIVKRFEVFTLDAVAESSDPDGDPLTYAWEFGDGQNSSFEFASYYYGNVGSFTIKLTVRDSFGETSEFEQVIQVEEEESSVPVPNISLNHYPSGEIYASGENSFSTDGSSLTYLWDFGDGTTSTLMETNHAYAQAGAYTVRLTVTNEAGLSQTLTKSISFASPLEEKHAYSPGDIEIVAGPIESVFNPITQAIIVNVTENVGVSGTLDIRLNDQEVQVSSVNGESSQFTAELVAKEGLNTIEILGVDNQGRTLEKSFEYYAGSKTVSLNLQSSDGSPISGVGFDIIMPDSVEVGKRHLSFAPTQTNALTLSNIPRQNLILKSNTGSYIIQKIGKDQTEVLAQEIPWTEPSDANNDDFSQGITGWKLKGSAQILTYPDGQKSLRVISTGEYAEISKTLVAGEDDLSVLSTLKSSVQDGDLIVLASRTLTENLEFKYFRAKELKSSLQTGWNLDLPLNPNEANEVIVRVYPESVPTSGGIWNFIKAYAQPTPSSIELSRLTRAIIRQNIPLIGYSRINPPDNRDAPKKENPDLSTKFTQINRFSIGPEFSCPGGRNRLSAGISNGSDSTSGLYDPNNGSGIVLPLDGSTSCANFIYVNPNATIRMPLNREVNIAGLLVSQANQRRALARSTVTSIRATGSEDQMLDSKLGKRPLFILDDAGTLTEDGGPVNLQVVFYQGPVQNFHANDIDCQDTENFLCFNLANALPVLVSTNNIANSGFRHLRYDTTGLGVGNRALKHQTIYGGDHWAHPTLANFLRSLKRSVNVGDISRANGGPFNPHAEHDTGLVMDFNTPRHGHNYRNHKDFWLRLEGLRAALPDDVENENGLKESIDIKNIGFSISLEGDTKKTNEPKSKTAEEYLNARCIGSIHGKFKILGGHATHWHLVMNEGRVEKNETTTSLEFSEVKYETVGGVEMFSNIYSVVGSLPLTSVVDVVKVTKDKTRNLVWSSSTMNAAVQTNDFDSSSFKVSLIDNVFKISIRSDLASEVIRDHEFIISEKSGNNCKEHKFKFKINGCENVPKGWLAEIGSLTADGAFVSDSSTVHEKATLDKDVSVCGESAIGEKITLSGNLRVEDSVIESFGKQSHYGASTSTPQNPAIIKNSNIRSNVVAFDDFKIINTDIVGETGAETNIGSSTIQAVEPLRTKIHGRVHFDTAFVSNSFLKGGTASVPSAAYLRVTGTVISAKAWGYGIIAGLLTNNAKFDGTYYETVDGSRQGNIANSGTVKDIGTKYKGISFWRGLMEAGCTTDTINGSNSAPGTVCTAGGSMRGMSQLAAGVLVSPLFNQAQVEVDGELKIIPTTVDPSIGVPLSPVYTIPEPGDI